MTRHKKELMECARMLKLGNLAEHLEELLHQAQEKQLTYPEFLLACLREEVRNRKDLYRRQACPGGGEKRIQGVYGYAGRSSDLPEDKGCFPACDENLQTDHEGTAAGH